MAKYIELEVAVKAFNNFDAGRADSPPCTLLTPEEFAEYLYELPAADVAPVVHAEWVVCGDGDNVPWMCSHCGKTTAHKYKVMYGKYCPHCGAKMDGGADHEAD